MEDEFGSGSVSDLSFAIPRSESKLMAGEKRSGGEFGEKAELARKRVKVRVFDSFLCSERDTLECGSTTGPLEEKDPMILWKEMKQNGFLSSSHAGIPTPKPHGRKSKNDGLKKKMELAKREQVDRFAKIAAPSELLTDLNPGIINHVRNSKQVHSIIEALVKSEKLKNHKAGSKQGILTKSGTKEISDRKKDLENANWIRSEPTQSFT
ncbi:hypothetical protein F0562_031491 [Nyssa sinensis]|uniref:Uncharacterized protein n=1 Tax=Nyssa sinensis TaxID=561372 RepID=A0A5J5AUL0_9ASTE|nr:hypothetical protein F0562_031491 [Nyssa sinensis]